MCESKKIKTNALNGKKTINIRDEAKTSEICDVRKHGERKLFSE